MRRPTAWCRRSPSGCAGWACTTDAVVGDRRCANTVESVLTLLGILRAGMIAHAAAAVVAARRSGRGAAPGRRQGADRQRSDRRASITVDLAMHIAAEIFPIRYVCGFGRDPPDGVVPFDDLYDGRRARIRSRDRGDRTDDAGAHLAVITWDVAADGLVPVARSHAELIAGALATAARRPHRAGRRRSCRRSPLSSFAALAISDGALADDRRHARAAPAVRSRTAFARSARRLRCATVIVPGPLVAPLARGRASCPPRTASTTSSASGARPSGCRQRRPGAIPRSRLIDVQVFGEIGLIAARRGADGKPAPSRFGAGRGAARPANGHRRRRRARRDRRRHGGAARRRWCRARPSRPARSAATMPYLQGRSPTASSTPAMPAGPIATRWW